MWQNTTAGTESIITTTLQLQRYLEYSFSLTLSYVEKTQGPCTKFLIQVNEPLKTAVNEGEVRK